MKTEALDKAVEAVNRFVDAVDDIRRAHAQRNKDPETYRVPETFDGCPKEQGALRRASMDLTRALADLRRTTP